MHVLSSVHLKETFDLFSESISIVTNTNIFFYNISKYKEYSLQL